MTERKERQTHEERGPAGEQGSRGRSFAGENYANTERQQTEDRRADHSSMDETGEAKTAAYPERTERNAGAAPSGREIDEAALRSEKSEWIEKQNPAAGDPMTDDERAAHDIIATDNVRDEAIPPVSGMNDVQDRGRTREAGTSSTKNERDEQDDRSQRGDERAR